MKKFAVISLSLVMVVCLTLIAIAGPGAFVQSPSNNPAPILTAYTADDEGCTAELVVTAYADRDTRPEEKRLALEEAYDQIVNHKDDNAFKAVMEQMAEKLGMTVPELSIAELFDISYYSCGVHIEEDHNGFTITLKLNTIENFKGIIHLQEDETWEILDVSDVNEAEGTITFHVDTLSPFATVVDNGSGEQAPQTGDLTMVYLGVMIAAACGLVIVLVAGKKRKA
ncbi:MAG: hypothetical protein IJ325_05825 [Clostridia bacterium]|nr:hypothetical protein [Clostridia bacterium]